MDMKHSVMTWRKETRLSPVPPPDGGPEGRGGAAFDLWLRRGLHQLFDDVANEPVPEELLRLIEGDRALASKAEGSVNSDLDAVPSAVDPLTDQATDGSETAGEKPAAQDVMGRPVAVHRTGGAEQ
jgi:hypothetical protein